METLNYLIEILRRYPVIPIFLTVGVGFWLGSLRYKALSLGTVAATLLTGVVVGQLDIPIPALVKSLFFILFLFSIGYSVGPQFFAALRGQGWQQMLFAAVEAAICVGTVFVAARLMGYDTGVSLGLFAGSQTCSAALGVISDTVAAMPMEATAKDHIQQMVPVCYAVTYVFGAIGSVWFLSIIAPRMLGGVKKVHDEAVAIERADGGTADTAEEHRVKASLSVAYRVYTAGGEYFDTPRSIADIEGRFGLKQLRLFIPRVRIGGIIYGHDTDMKVKSGDEIVLAGRRDVLVREGDRLGSETTDPELLDFEAETLPVSVNARDVAGKTVGQLRGRDFMEGVVIRSVTRGGATLPPLASTVLRRGDVVTLVGLPGEVNMAATSIGYPHRADGTTDIVYISLGIALGCFIGALSVKVENIPLSLSTTGGALLMGLIFGWWRNRHPAVGYVPPQVIWFLDNLGLNLFIAVIGLTAGPTFLPGLRDVGVGLFLTGAAATVIPMVICLWIGRKIFRFSRPETLGCIAGSRCCAAAIGAIQDAVGSTVPMLGYTVTYAVANFILVFSSLVILFLV